MPAPDERTHARADQRAFAAFLGVVAGGRADHGARDRANAGTLGSVVDLLLAGVGVSGLAAGDREGGGDG